MWSEVRGVCGVQQILRFVMGKMADLKCATALHVWGIRLRCGMTLSSTRPTVAG